MKKRSLVLLMLLYASARASDPIGQAPRQSLGAGSEPQSSPRSDRLAATGLDVKELDQKAKTQLLELLDKYSSPCGRAHSLYHSLVEDKGCKRAPYAGHFLVFLVGLGLTPEEVAEHYENRFVTPHQGQCRPGGQIRGDAKAPLTICEFSDFQCPHCKAAEPILKKLLDDYKGKVRLLFKNFPLSSHPDAKNAAAAAVAAGLQGKFWPMHDRLFEHQDKMSEADLERDARELKLDIQKWKADLSAAATQVEAERAEGVVLKVDHTPTLFIGNREYRGPLRYEYMKDWVDEALVQ
jgi:predicted DsbA family dithiol-disulfide isomerase